MPGGAREPRGAERYLQTLITLAMQEQGLIKFIIIALPLKCCATDRLGLRTGITDGKRTDGGLLRTERLVITVVSPLERRVAVALASRLSPLGFFSAEAIKDPAARLRLRTGPPLGRLGCGAAVDLQKTFCNYGGNLLIFDID